MTEKELLLEVLSETLNLDVDGVASYFNEDGTVKDDAKDMILNAYSEHAKSLKTGSSKTAFDDGYKKAQSEVLKKFENDFKAKTGFKSDKLGIDLVLEYANAQSKGGELTEDAIKKHPLFISQQEQHQAELEAARSEGETKLNQFQTELSKKETFNKVANKGLELFHSLKPVLSKEPSKAKKQESLFIEKLQNYEWDLQNNGDRIVPLKDGKVFENAQGHAVAFEKLVKDIASEYFDFHIADDKNSPANKNLPNGDQKKTFNFEAPKSANEYAAFVGDSSKTIEERDAYKEAFKGKI